jgi:hypothetical protein
MAARGHRILNCWCYEQNQKSLGRVHTSSRKTGNGAPYSMGCVHDSLRIHGRIKYNLRSLRSPFSPPFQRGHCYLCRSDNLYLWCNSGYHFGESPPPEEFQPAGTNFKSRMNDNLKMFLYMVRHDPAVVVGLALIGAASTLFFHVTLKLSRVGFRSYVVSSRATVLFQGNTSKCAKSTVGLRGLCIVSGRA